MRISKTNEDKSMRELVKAFKALSDETRLRILNVLLERECCVCEVMQALEISQTRASRNLSILHDAGLLRLRKEGVWALYSINREGLAEHLADLIEGVQKGLADNQLALRDREHLSRAKRVGQVALKAEGLAENSRETAHPDLQ